MSLHSNVKRVTTHVLYGHEAEGGEDRHVDRV